MPWQASTTVIALSDGFGGEGTDAHELWQAAATRDRVRIPSCFQSRVRLPKLGRYLQRISHGHGIVNGHVCAKVIQATSDIEAWRVPHIIGARLKCCAPDR